MSSQIDSDVVQAACLAHDLGHPPFGHTAEEELKILAKEAGLRDLFEGNAQSFRIVTTLAFRSPVHAGLDLTCATLGAILKYPRLKDDNKKWGAYDSESWDFEWASQLLPGPGERSVEAEIMDWSDDITYAVHDVEDFYRAGRIPLHLLNDRKYDRERKTFYDEVFDRRKGEGGVWTQYSRVELEAAFESVVGIFEIDRPYDGTQGHRAKLRKFSSECINLFVKALSVRKPSDQNKRAVEINPQYEKQVVMLKEMTWHYVITAPSLTTLQHGQRKLIRGLFECLLTAAQKGNFGVFPSFYREKLEKATDTALARLVIDLIAGLTERQCIDIFRTLTGLSVNPSFDRVV